MSSLTILTLLIIKHFIIDFPLQTPYQYLNKGTYGHPGGLLHSLLHAVGSAAILLILSTPLPIVGILAAVEFVVHYHTDWAKTNVNKRMAWGPSTHEEFWILLGVDQLIHYLTYVAIAYYGSITYS